MTCVLHGILCLRLLRRQMCFCSALIVKALVLQSSWSASRTLMRFFIISKLEKKIMFTMHERRTDTPRPTSVRSQY